jgi:oligopeptide/dipeptide ABC transporter ATP-binding protein
MLFVAHDLGVVRHVSDRVAVMYVGRIVETAPTAALYARPRHPYTEALLAAVPKADPALRDQASAPIGEIADPANPPPGCAFHPRCPDAMPRCAIQEPSETRFGPDWTARCWLAGEHPAREEYDSAST